ncbi:MAG: UDP-3-O-[Lentisphaeria bacterium]|nr:UDP-3-O-[3-hydroxymyristoyl] N-acetylglucosamine deacetylase [Lentisphaeria bacterium]
MEKQQTLAKKVRLSGIALHTGVRATLNLLPADENAGIVFRRVDMDGKPEVRALAANVVDVQRGTTIASGRAVVYTVEHIMSALHASGIDNCVVEMDGQEPPICDGSSLPFLELIRSAGTVVQSADARFYTVPAPLRVINGHSQIVIFPDREKLTISCVTSFKGCPFDPQFMEYVLDPETYGAEIAPGRTFVDFKDLKMLLAMGLVKGGSLDAAAIIHNGAIICKEKLRFQNEIVRHKILDLIGDLYLTGVRMRGNVIAIRPGHPTNVKTAGEILKTMQK